MARGCHQRDWWRFPSAPRKALLSLSTVCAPDYFVKYADLYNMLYDLAICAGASITFNTEIMSVYVDEEKEMPMVMLADGTLLTADLVLGADGSRSVAREAVTGQVESEPPSDHSFFT